DDDRLCARSRHGAAHGRECRMAHRPRPRLHHAELRAMMRWHLLERWIKERGWTRGVEIGVFGGRTFLHLLESCPALTMIGVDTWTPAPEKQARYAEGGRSYESANLPALEREVAAKSAKFGERAILYKGDSVDVAQLIPD